MIFISIGNYVDFNEDCDKYIPDFLDVLEEALPNDSENVNYYQNAYYQNAFQELIVDYYLAYMGEIRN
jgi:hypothetical protein